MTSAVERRYYARTLATRALLAVALVGLVAPASAQSVQIPATSPGVTSPANPVWGAAPSTFAPAAPLGAPPPAFNAYSAAPAAPYYGAPPVTGSPYTYTPPVTGAPAYDYGAPPSPAGLGSEGNALGWQPGTYGYQQSDSTTVKFRQFLARLRAEHTLLLGDNSGDAFQVNRTEIASTFAVPVGGTLESPLLITPGFAFNWFEGPEGDPTADPRGPDLPPRVYDAYLDFAYNPRWTPEIGAEFGFRTGVWTDFEEFSGDTMRFLGRGLGVFSVSPQFEFLVGAVYLDRLKIKLLPAGGIRWRPSPVWDLYLVFPNPKIRRTMFSNGSADWWWYVAGEYGGGSWTVERPGLSDQIDYNDIRVVFGFEWQTPTQATGHFEIGYAFDREIVFDSNMPGQQSTDDAVLFRAGIGY